MMSDVREVVNSATSAFERVLLSLDGSSVAEAILPHAMTTHGRGASRRIVGSVADQVLRARSAVFSSSGQPDCQCGGA